MSLSSKQLENDIEAMENRLAKVKVVVEIEKHAWKKVARKGKCGAKWKGAVTNNAKTTGSTAATTSARSETENPQGEIVVEPMQWDALELAQHLQSKQLAPYAQVVVFENITGKLLLETPPGRLRSVFDGIVTGKSDATWKEFLRVCSQLHKLQKSMNPAHSNRQDEPNQRKPVSTPPKTTGSGVVFPLISPRAPAILASSLASKMHKPQPPPPTASLLVGDPDARQLKTAAPHALGRKASSSSLTQQMATCWNCGARFPRALPSTIPSRSGPTMSSAGSKPVSTKLYCSKACEDAIESSDMSVSASLNVAVPHDTIQHQAPKPPPSHGATLKAVIKSPRHQPPASNATNNSFSFLQVAHTGPSTTLESDSTRQPTGVVKHPSGRKRMVAPVVSGGLSPVASITAVRCLPDDAIPPSLLLHGANSTRLQSRVFQQSRYKLDPELFDPNRAHWSACFDATLPSAQNFGCIENSRVVNLETLVGFLSNKGVYRLSLTCRKWFELVHVHTATVDRVWTLLLQRSWIQDDEDWKCLRDLGFVSTKAKKPRRLMMKLTRHVQKAVLEGMKVLLNVENWQLAPTCRNDLDYLPLPLRRSQWMALNVSGRDDTSEPIDRGNDLYEVITVICNRSCEIVAVQAQELIRPIAEDRSTIEILNGVKNGSLWCVECRRLRLFSTANRLPFSEWYLLPDILVMLEFCTRQDPRSTENPGPSTWQLKVLSRLQIQMDKRLLSKESVQQVMKGAQERNAPDDALAAMEQFLLQHAPTLVTSGASRCKPRG